MNEFYETKLGTICEIFTGFPFKGNMYSDHGILPVLRGENVTIGNLRWDTRKYWNHSIENLSNYLLKEHDVVIGMDGSRVGKNRAAVRSSELPLILAQRVARLRAKEGFSQKLLKYLIMNKSFVEYVDAIHTGTSIPHISPKQIFDFEVHLPVSLILQESIAEILSSLDDKIELLHNNNKTLEELAETLFRQWFIEEAKEDWLEIKLGHFITPKKGKNITKSEAIEGLHPVVAGGLEPSCYHNKSNTKAPVITISASGANAGFVKLYYTEIWSSDSSFIDETITDYVYFFYVLLKLKQSQIFDKQEGSAQPHIYPSHIMDLEIYNYPINLIDTFNQTVKPFFNKISSNLLQIQQLETLRDTLLPKLMSGLVRVEN